MVRVKKPAADAGLSGKNLPPVHTKCGGFHAAEKLTSKRTSGGRAAYKSELVTEARAVRPATGGGVVRTVVRVTVLLFTLVRQVDAFNGEFQVF